MNEIASAKNWFWIKLVLNLFLVSQKIILQQKGAMGTQLTYKFKQFMSECFYSKIMLKTTWYNFYLTQNLLLYKW